MALRKVLQGSAAQAAKVDRSSVVNLYRSVIKELPRVMTIYDIDIPLADARAQISKQFRKNGHLEDGNVIGLLVSKGYMELEETLMQWKQKTHLMRILDPLSDRILQRDSLSDRQKLALGIDDDF